MSYDAILEIPNVVVVSGPAGQSFRPVDDAAELTADFGRDGDRAIIRANGDEWLKTAGVWAATGENFWGTLLAQAAEQVDLARRWAEEDPDVEVDGGFSALHWAGRAEYWATRPEVITVSMNIASVISAAANMAAIIAAPAAAAAAAASAGAAATSELGAEGFRDEAEAYALAAQSVSTELSHPVSRTALKALNTATHTAAVVVEPGFERIARFDPSADPYMNTVDPNELVFAQPTPAAAGSWAMSPIPKKQIGIFEQIKYRMTIGKVDFVGIGDSNQILSGHGWDHGFQYALTALGFPMWATGLISQNENNGSGSGQGYLYNRNGSLVGAVSGAPADLDKYLNKGLGSIFPAYYTYIADGGSFGSTLANGLVVVGTCPLDTSAALAFDGYYGTFTSGAGAFRPFARWEETPFTTLSDPGTMSTNTGAYGIQKVTLTVAADPARVGKQVGMRWTRPSVAGIVGPFFCTYMRARNTNRNTGFAYGTLEYRGGQSARTMAYDLQQASNDALTHYFSILRADQGSGPKTIVICINSGLNDRNATLASVGTAAIVDGDSAPAFIDNVRAIVDRLKAIWTLNGWDRRELFWLLQVSHPVSTPDDAELVAYRGALEAYALYLDQAQVIDLSVVVPYADLIANGWYLNPVSDHNHLTQAGYEGASLAILKATL
ncbi:SGNH/GDSL hydrolase family protein [Mesorhizobium sp.]|uniref:SGNH/GDSL hydrolase family protein n=1 Tax=Mesorhizobium sp. TaxID=1871066 RepID=UPI0011FAAC67|nr:SGNH/GDSL hydrolase family protein [Mesorhizobium sp.]TIL54403.1 MAG: hypothetical protein E5Y83_02895 [Mesorhizobium sp.]